MVNNRINTTQQNGKDVLQMINKYERSFGASIWRTVICCADSENEKIRKVYKTALLDNKYLIIDEKDGTNSRNVIPAGIITDNAKNICVYTDNSFNKKQNINVNNINKIEVGEKIVIEDCYKIRQVKNDKENISKVLSKPYEIVVDKKIYPAKDWCFKENSLLVNGKKVIIKDRVEYNPHARNPQINRTKTTKINDLKYKGYKLFTENQKQPEKIRFANIPKSGNITPEEITILMTTLECH
jgi:hypothetical protein